MLYTKFSFLDIPRVFFRSLRGKSLPRLYLNLVLDRYSFPRLEGKIVDLGSKTDHASYHKHLKKAPDADFTFCDYYSGGENVIKLDLEQKFPEELKKFDTALLFNTMEHIFDTENLLSETSRILKKRGRLIGSVPFLYPFHADPNDYHRFTHSALKILFEKHGFKIHQLIAVSHGPLTLGFQALPFPKLIRGPLQATLFCCDKLISWYTRRYKEQFIVMYVFDVVKTDS